LIRREKPLESTKQPTGYSMIWRCGEHWIKSSE
jgi:hypothetical protein